MARSIAVLLMGLNFALSPVVFADQHEDGHDDSTEEHSSDNGSEDNYDDESSED